ncbi:hypothetical protein GCM10009624_19410 [Gordonia sinesedis]
MKWIATIRDYSNLGDKSLLDVLTGSISVVTGDVEREVLAEGRARITPGTGCEMYRLPDDFRDVVAVDDLPAASLSALRILRYTYEAGYTDEEVRQAGNDVGLEIPSRWRQYLTSSSVFRDGWLDTDEYLSIYAPKDIAEITNVCYEWGPRNGAIMIGGSAGSDWLQLDTRAGNRSPVVLLSSGDQGWHDTNIQAATIDEFIDRVESGRFEFMDDAPHYQPDR